MSKNLRACRELIITTLSNSFFLRDDCERKKMTWRVGQARKEAVRTVFICTNSICDNLNELFYPFLMVKNYIDIHPNNP